jgi:beta-lactam-binding protein with PASTA domain
LEVRLVSPRLRVGSLSTITLSLLAFLVANPATTSAQVSVWTNHNDNARTGANLRETQLTTTTVSANGFGKLFSYNVDGMIFGQPLYLPSLQIPGKGLHNVVLVATANDSVYAFDADTNTGANAVPLWQVNFTNPPGITPVPTGNPSVDGTLGIMGTPVIDEASGTMYLVARTLESGKYLQRLHALDVTTGAERFGGPVAINADYPGTGDESAGGRVHFNAKMENQRAGLALANGVVYVCWASWGDIDPFHGWVLGFDKSTLQLSSVFNATPDGGRGGIWMSGQPPAIDSAGNLFFSVGNGDWDGVTNFGESVLKLSSALTVKDWFTPDNYAYLNENDLDINVSGVLLVPNTSVLVNGSKTGQLFVMRQDSLGHLQNGNGQIVQTLNINAGHLHGSPVYWNSPTRGPLMYVWAEQDNLKAFHFNGAAFDAVPQMKSDFAAPGGMPGAMLSVSSNGATAGTGILWASMPLQGDALNELVPGVLRAFDADDLSRELWNSQQNGARDGVGTFAKFGPPTVANGKVYLATFSNQLNVYGRLTAPDPPTNLVAGVSGSTVTLSWSVPAGGTAVSAYNVYKAPNAGFTPSPVNLLGQSSTPTFTDATVPDGLYFYRVVALDAANHPSLPSNEATARVGQPSNGDPVVDQIVFSHGTGSRTTPLFSTSKANELLVAFVGSDGPSPGTQSATVSGAGLSWRLVTRANSQPGTSEIWTATAAAPLSNVAVSAAQSGGAFYQSLTVVTFTNAAVGAAANANAATGAPSVTVNATQARSLIYGVGNDWDRAVARTVGANQTKVDEYAPAVGDTFWVQRRSAPTLAPGAAQLNDTAPTNDHWNFAGVEIVPAGPPPTLTISSVAVSSLTSTSATITWATNVPATGQVQFGPTISYGNATSDLALVTGHQALLTGLQPATTYHYLVTSKDTTQQSASAGDFTLTTPPLTQVTCVLTAPAAGTVAGLVTVSVDAHSTANVAGVQFVVDGGKLGSEILTAPYSMSWDSNSVANGSHTLSAVARDSTGNTVTAAPVVVNVNNTTTVPNLVGQPRATVAGILATSGLTLGIVANQISTSVPIDVVVSQSPASNTQAPRGDAVNVWISVGIGVPDVVGQPESVVSSLLAPANLFKGATSLQPSSTIAAGNVISQSPAAGTFVSGGSAVALVVSSGPPPPGPAAPTIDKVVGADGVSARTTTPFSTSGPGEFLVAFVACDGPASGAQTATVSGAGLTWTLVRRANVRPGTAEIWTARAPLQLNNVTVTSTPARTGYQQALTIVAFTGATGAGASAAANAATGAPTVTLVTTKSNSVVYGVGNDWDRAVARTLGPNQTMIRQSINASAGDTFWVQAQLSSFSSSTSVQLNDTAPTNDRWNFASIEIFP